MSSLYIFGLISALLNVICYIPYIIDILKNKTKPARSSWLIWGVMGTIAFITQLAKGATNSLWLPGAQTLGVTTVLFLSLKKGTGGLTRRDVISLIIAGIGLIVWLLTSEAAFALYIVILINIVGGIPTIIKSFEKPGSETLMTWILGTLAGLFAIFSVGQPSFVLLIYPIIVFLINFAVLAAMFFGKRRKIIPAQ